MESKRCNLGLTDDIKARMESDQMESFALWDVAMERVKLLTGKILLTTEKVNGLNRELMSVEIFLSNFLVFNYFFYNLDQTCPAR